MVRSVVAWEHFCFAALDICLLMMLVGSKAVVEVAWLNLLWTESVVREFVSLCSLMVERDPGVV